jgi:hypothetical protein
MASFMKRRLIGRRIKIDALTSAQHGAIREHKSPQDFFIVNA